MTDDQDDFDLGAPGEKVEPFLNEMAYEYIDEAIMHGGDLGILDVPNDSGAFILDFGVEAPGGLGAGMALIEISTAGQVEAELQQLDFDGSRWPHVVVMVDQPVEACLMSQYAGWKLATDDYFAIASGPMRAARGQEEIFQLSGYQENAQRVAGVLESGSLPTASAIERIASECGVPASGIALAVAPTASVAGGMQVVARSVETAMHKLLELGFDLSRVTCGCGSAPIAPVAENDLAAIGRTNDAILYGGSVTLWVTGDDYSLSEIGRDVPASASTLFGKPFIDIFEDAGRDFYKIDPMLFSPAEVIFHNIETGQVHRYGAREESVLKRSFGL